MQRPESWPEDLWHDESPLDCLIWLEETARFLWEAGLYEDQSTYLDPDWRERVQALMEQGAKPADHH